MGCSKCFASKEKEALNSWRDAKRKCLHFWIAAGWEYHFCHTGSITLSCLLFPCSLLAWKTGSILSGWLTGREKDLDNGQWRTSFRSYGRRQWGRGFILESGERSKTAGRAGNHSRCYLLKTRIISLEREDRPVLKQLSLLGNDTVLDRSFSSLFNLQRDCEKTQSIRTNLNHLFDHLANCKHCLLRK